VRSSERATARASVVFPTPGTSSRRNVTLDEQRAEELLRHLALSDHDRGDVLYEAARSPPEQ